MKKILSIMTSLLMISLLMFTPMKAFAVTGNMIDVSSNNGVVDWDSVKPFINGGVIIRLGFGSDITSQDDSQFIKNVSECERLGIPYGIYLYSYALNYDDAQSEIDHALRLAKTCNPTLGVWYDMEDADGYKSRHNLNVYEKGNMLTDFCIEFMSAMCDNGYTTGTYANYNYFTNVLNMDRLKATKGFNMWLAHWGIDTPSMECKIWQFGSYEINGYEYDGDIIYSDFNTQITPASEVDYSAIYTQQIDSNVNTYYQVQINGNQWLPVVQNDADYAGIIGQKITGIAISVDKGYCEYQVHTSTGWHGIINSQNTNINDYINGYAGNGQAIDAVKVYYYTPDDIAGSTGYQKSCYEVSPLHGNYFSEQYDDNTDNGQDGYAGSFGRSIDRLQIVVK